MKRGSQIESRLRRRALVLEKMQDEPAPFTSREIEVATGMPPWLVRRTIGALVASGDLHHVGHRSTTSAGGKTVTREAYVLARKGESC